MKGAKIIPGFNLPNLWTVKLKTFAVKQDIEIIMCNSYSANQLAN